MKITKLKERNVRNPARNKDMEPSRNKEITNEIHTYRKKYIATERKTDGKRERTDKITK